jgi:predicted ATPase
VFIREIALASTEGADLDAYPFTLPAIAKLGVIELDRPITLLIGPDGSGKSTLLESVAVAAGLEGVTSTSSSLWRHLRLVRDEPRPYSGGLLRPHQVLDPSVTGRDGLYLLDEPESGMTVADQLQLVRRMHALSHQRSQFLVATHSPVIVALPGARIYEAGDWGFQPVEFAETPQFDLARAFVSDPARLVDHLLGPS